MGFWDILEVINEKIYDFANYTQNYYSRNIEKYGEKLSEEELRHAIKCADGRAKEILGKIYKRKFR